MKKLAAILVLLTGCNLYFDGGDDDPPCHNYGYDTGAPEPALQLRNPHTGECETFYGGGGYPCDDRCGPCPVVGQDYAVPNWPQCDSQCEALDEFSCLSAPGCQTAYDTNEYAMPDGTRGFQFIGCWATTSPYTDDRPPCASLDAEQCSARDYCSINYLSKHAPDDGIERAFNHCAPEGGSGTVCYSDADCGSDERCTAGYEECGPPEGCQDGMGCPDVCTGHCVPKQSSCDLIDCGPGSRCEEQCKVGPNGQVFCEPVCVSNTTCAAVDCGPGYHCVETCTAPNPMDPNTPGCGECSPQCVPNEQPVMCEEISDETQCHARGDCTPVYDGQDCTCYPDGCTCNILTFERCQSGGGGTTPPRM